MKRCLAATLACVFADLAWGHGVYLNSLPNGNQVGHSVGHFQSYGGGERTQFGEDFVSAGYAWTTTLCRTDSDGDGRTNGEELGDPCCVWSSGKTPKCTSGISNPGLARSPVSTSCNCESGGGSDGGGGSGGDGGGGSGGDSSGGTGDDDNDSGGDTVGNDGGSGGDTGGGTGDTGGDSGSDADGDTGTGGTTGGTPGDSTSGTTGGSTGGTTATAGGGLLRGRSADDSTSDKGGADAVVGASSATAAPRCAAGSVMCLPVWLVVHGVFMVVAWFFVIPGGILVAAFRKKVGPKWMALHKAANLVGTVLTVAGSAVAIAATVWHGRTYHSIFGLFIFAASVPMAASGLLRPQARSPHPTLALKKPSSTAMEVGTTPAMAQENMVENGKAVQSVTQHDAPKRNLRIIWEAAHKNIGRALALLAIATAVLGFMLVIF